MQPSSLLHTNESTGSGNSWAMPDFALIKAALTIQLQQPQNLLIFLDGPDELNLDAVREFMRDKDRIQTTRTCARSPWVYVCCDYTIGLIFGLIELGTKKKMVRDFGVSVSLAEVYLLR